MDTGYAIKTIQTWVRKNTSSKSLIKTIHVKLFSPDGLQVYFNDGRWVRVSYLRKYYQLRDN